jgi:predicted transcriptional regulator
MPTTSLKLSDEIKQRAISAAQKLGISPHAFMVSAIDQAATLAEQRAAFIADAKRARERLMKTGKGYVADEVHSYFKSRVAGKKVAKPREKTWRA